VESWIATAHSNDVFLSNDVISDRAWKPGSGTSYLAFLAQAATSMAADPDREQDKPR
jgi:hypothetical protein